MEAQREVSTKRTSEQESSLSALPVEILHEIIGCLQCLDIESITLTCRFLYNIGESALVRHRILRQRYWKLAYRDLPNCKVYRSIEHPIELFAAILTDPSIAAYITRVNIGYAREDSFDLAPFQASIEHDTHAKHGKIINDRLDDIMAYFDKYIALLEATDCWDSFVGEVFALHRGPILALLFTTFSNLKHLSFQERGVLSPWLKIIFAIAASRVQPSDARRPLGKLQTLEIAGNSVDLRNLAPIMNIPSLRLFRLKGSFGIGLSSMSGALAAAASNITSLELVKCSISINSIGALISRISNLQNFAYHSVAHQFGHRYHDCFDSCWNPRRFAEFLARYAGRSLCSLTLLGDYVASGSYRLSKDKIIHAFVGSLRRFQVLRLIRVDLAMLIDGPREIWRSDEGVLLPFIGEDGDSNENFREQSETEYEEDEEEEEDFRWEQSRWGRELPPAWYLDVSDKTNIVHPLINILPASIETLAIEMQLDQHIMQQLLRRLPERKEERLPNLKEISYECEECHCMVDMEKDCATVDVKLTQMLKYGNFKCRKRGSLSNSDYSGCSEGDEGIAGLNDFEDYDPTDHYDYGYDDYGSGDHWHEDDYSNSDHYRDFLINEEATLLREVGTEAVNGMIDEENTKIQEDIEGFEWLVSQAEQMMGIEADFRSEESISTEPQGRKLGVLDAEYVGQYESSMSSYEKLILAQRH